MIPLVHSPAALEAAQRIRDRIGARRHFIAQPYEDTLPEALESGYAKQVRESGKVLALTACRLIRYPITSDAVAEFAHIHRRVASEYLCRLERAGKIEHVADVRSGPARPIKVYRIAEGER